MEHGKAEELHDIVGIGKENEESKIKDGYYDNSQSRNDHVQFRRQVLVSFGTFMITMSAGATVGYSAILIPQLQHEMGKEKYSIDMVSWLASMSSFALVFGNVISGHLMDKLGRRKSQLFVGISFTCGWTIISFSNNVLPLILIGRFITGLSQGWLGPLGPVFVAEISSPKHRGLLLASLSLAIAVGVFMSHLLGTLMKWNICALICGAFATIGSAIMFYAPESPPWLASRNRIDDCIKSFYWYRGTNVEMKSELDRIIFEQANRRSTHGKLKTFCMNIKKPEFWKPLLIMMTFFVITQLSGVNVICAYTTDMMKELIGKKSNSSSTYIAMLSIDILRCASLIAVCIMLRRSGRRPLAVFSGIFTSISLISLALYLYLVNNRVIKHLSPTVSLGLLAVYIIVSNLGISLLPWNMVGEVFATETKGLGSGISVMMTSVTYFVTLKIAPFMFEGIGQHGTYLFYGLSTLTGTLFLYCFLPETKDKTLLQIEDYFRYNKKYGNANLNEKLQTKVLV